VKFVGASFVLPVDLRVLSGLCAFVSRVWLFARTKLDGTRAWREVQKVC
jgi:hypothetical protein